jgi:hypothetical protein
LRKKIALLHVGKLYIKKMATVMMITTFVVATGMEVIAVMASSTSAQTVCAWTLITSKVIAVQAAALPTTLVMDFVMTITIIVVVDGMVVIAAGTLEKTNSTIIVQTALAWIQLHKRREATAQKDVGQVHMSVMDFVMTVTIIAVVTGTMETAVAAQGRINSSITVQTVYV